MKSVKIEIGLGETLDRLTILNLKIKKLTAEKQEIAKREKVKVDAALDSIGFSFTPEILEQFTSLYEVNKKLWDIEDELRRLDEKVFAQPGTDDATRKWMELARSVYIVNDERYRIKNLIDETFGGGTHEVKSYA
tara:strand:- start:2349 stop:2753 length:405 start_codon:yes stop_codon:yes gene_type:complete